MFEYNLVVSCPRGHEKGAISEIRYFIEGLLGDSNLVIKSSGISGIIFVRTSLSPHFVIKKLLEFANDNPYQFSFAIRFLPIDICTESNLEKIREAAKLISKHISENETFRITVRKRDTRLSSHEIINIIASEIERKVNLENPDKTVFVEIIGDFTFLSILTSDEEILSIRKMQ